MLKKLLTWLLAAFAIFYILTNPADAAGLVSGAAHGVVQAGTQVIKFCNALT